MAIKTIEKEKIYTVPNNDVFYENLEDIDLDDLEDGDEIEVWEKTDSKYVEVEKKVS